MDTLVKPISLREANLGITERNQIQVLEVLERSQDSSFMFSAIPLLCKGSECVMKNQCKYFAEGTHPLNSRCPIEIGLIIRLFDSYVTDLNVDPTNIVETSIVRDLVNIEIKLMRAAGKYAEEGDFEKMVIIGIGDDGTPFTKPELSNHVIVDEKLMNKKRDLLKMMAATREEKLRNKQIKDPSSYAADLLEQAKVIDGESSQDNV